ncbi:unnamed protein product [Didymodactylos carnosus]|uniref:Uncharacterized protein n=1 Tax=Didymodactylos carnosus TaxID=1234261 RepID=A0A8S2Y2E2_9BILA|nr:unnamed protein product [Didymodactylos carnosus]
MHLQSISTASAKLTKNDNNTIIGKINAINVNNCTLNYLRALTRTFLFMLTQEFALNNFEDLIKLQASNLAEPITKWLSVSNNDIGVGKVQLNGCSVLNHIYEKSN